MSQQLQPRKPQPQAGKVNYATVFVDTFDSGTPRMDPIGHATEGAARKYAAELTTRRQGHCEVLGEFANVLAVYQNGEPIAIV